MDSALMRDTDERNATIAKEKRRPFTGAALNVRKWPWGTYETKLAISAIQANFAAIL
jgi:hypothetical protein